MAATKLYLQQLHQSAATDGQIAQWSSALGCWIPATATGVPLCRSYFVATGGETIIYLNSTPVAASDEVYVNGLRKAWGGVDYTLTGSIITLTSALSAADKVVVAYATSSSCGIASLSKPPTGFTRPVSVTRPVRRFHRIR